MAEDIVVHLLRRNDDECAYCKQYLPRHESTEVQTLGNEWWFMGVRAGNRRYFVFDVKQWDHLPKGLVSCASASAGTACDACKGYGTFAHLDAPNIRKCKKCDGTGRMWPVPKSAGAMKRHKCQTADGYFGACPQCAEEASIKTLHVLSDLEKHRQVMESPVFCEHANENPRVCPCPSDCYCRSRTCKDKGPRAATTDAAAVQKPPVKMTGATGRSYDVPTAVVADLYDRGILNLVSHVEARTKAGEAKYGTRLQAFNGRDAGLDALQEAIDLIKYVKQKKMEGAAGWGAIYDLSLVLADLIDGARKAEGK